MIRIRSYTLMILALGLASCAFGQDFKVFSTYVQAHEGGGQRVLVMETDGRRFSIGSPKLYGSKIQPNDRKIVFTSTLCASVMTIRFTTNYAGKLPPRDNLRDEVAAKYPAASLVSSRVCYTDYGQGQYFELFQPTSGNLMLKMRDAYVAVPEGSVEFTLSCNGSDYDKQKLYFARLLNSFRCVPEDAKRNL
ncbi:MAG TPA: hypothetical protein VH619_05425 [Verrucomicrobiae bacterium]|jgi:hypothetical protein|nr:hypothetical protein [Verrucomicrobiae bacterium]